MWPGPFGATMITSCAGRRADATVEDVEAVREEQRRARREVRRDLLLVDLRLHLVGQQDRDQLCARDRLGDRS